MKYTILVLLLLAAVAVSDKPSRDRNNQKYRFVCYLGSWANYRPDDGKFLIEDIDPFACTHLVYGFAKLDWGNKIAAYDPYLDLEENWGKGAYKRFNNLRQQNPYLTTILAIGGWNEGSTKYSKMASSAATRKIFAESCVEFLLKYDFDGLDMDWEYPGTRGGVPEDKQNFVLLLKELKEHFAPHGLLLTAAVSAGQPTIDAAYDIPQVSKYLDIINVMTYDFHGAWEDFTGHNAPLFGRPDEPEEHNFLNIDYAINYWLKGGADPQKMVLGMPLYTRCFTLAKSENHGFMAAASGPGEAGPWTREKGIWGYNELCLELKKGSWKTVLDPHTLAPYGVRDRQWCGYDDEESIRTKVHYLKQMNLSGGMVWSIETDDFRGKCSGGKNPLLKTIRDELEIDTTPLPITTPSTTTRRTLGPDETDEPTQSTPFDENNIRCTSSGFHPFPTDCTRFYECIPLDGGRFSVLLQKCWSGTGFDPETKKCVDKSKIPGCE